MTGTSYLKKWEYWLAEDTPHGFDHRAELKTFLLNSFFTQLHLQNSSMSLFSFAVWAGGKLFFLVKLGNSRLLKTSLHHGDRA